VYSRCGALAKEVLSNPDGWPLFVAFDEPVMVVVISEFLKGLVEVI